MKEFRGTKGQWTISEDMPEKNEYGAYGLDLHFGRVLGSATVWLTESVENEEELANAKLIASAPELLEALQEILPHIGNYEDLHVSVQKKYLKAEKAISKALD